ncbi:hypothetical protein [Gaoshiqia sediminis]|uniref:Glycosyltransferase 2-like domain-containing protein n=1 Tax=Gaoshiqia sediminis TaxID=2986998 RepID=A0AA41YCN7_9BACT|nr:hypothetical protein [Gaoshiqia sediminis]MCW0484118.1 hypothetical protein [Gaoshiqia sediminis]
MKPAIVIATYNRPASLLRLLSSVENAIYNVQDVPLVISIDGGGTNNQETCRIAEDFDWSFGSKRIIKHDQNLGLRNHILSCGDLSEVYGAVIVLEDDIYVSPNFYKYACSAAEYYKNDEKIAQISLYSFNIHIHTLLPFVPLKSEYDTFFMQYGCSWGQCWTKSQWSDFRQWYNIGQEVSKSDKLPSNIVSWPESSWLKYFTKYLMVSDKVSVYPYWGYATNINDAGVHNRADQFTYQCQLATQSIDSNFAPYHNESIKYDAYFELNATYIKALNKDLAKFEFEVDLYGQKLLDGVKAEYFLSTFECSSPLLKFPMILKPLEQNILLNIQHNQNNIFLGKKEAFAVKDNRTRIWVYYTLPLSIGKAIKQLIQRIWKSLAYYAKRIM